MDEVAQCLESRRVEAIGWNTHWGISKIAENLLLNKSLSLGYNKNIVSWHVEMAL